MERHRAIAQGVHKLINQGVSAGTKFCRGTLGRHTTMRQNDHMVRDLESLGHIM